MPNPVTLKRALAAVRQHIESAPACASRDVLLRELDQGADYAGIGNVRHAIQALESAKMFLEQAPTLSTPAIMLSISQALR